MLPTPQQRVLARCLNLKELDPSRLALYVDVVVDKLHHASPDVRRVAVETLGNLEPVELAKYAESVVAMLDDQLDNPIKAARVIKAALQTLGKLDPITLANHVHHVVVRLFDSDEGVRLEAMKTLGKLEPATLNNHARKVVMMLRNPQGDMRVEAMKTLAMMEPTTIERHVDAGPWP